MGRGCLVIYKELEKRKSCHLEEPLAKENIFSRFSYNPNNII